MNHELLAKHAPLFVIGTFMAFVCAALAAAQLLTTDMFFELWFTAGCALALSVAMFFCMPARLAKATLFLFLTNTTSVSFGSAMQYWFTVDETVQPGGAALRLPLLHRVHGGDRAALRRAGHLPVQRVLLAVPDAAGADDQRAHLFDGVHR
jgi:hypothetical protein